VRADDLHAESSRLATASAVRLPARAKVRR